MSASILLAIGPGERVGTSGTSGDMMGRRPRQPWLEDNKVPTTCTKDRGRLSKTRGKREARHGSSQESSQQKIKSERRTPSFQQPPSNETAAQPTHPPAHVSQAHRTPPLCGIVNRAHFPRAALVGCTAPRSSQGFHFESDVGGGSL